MAFKQTIAFIGHKNALFKDVVGKLAGVNYPLLLIADRDGQQQQSPIGINLHSLGTDIETVECVKDACWQADVVILLDAVAYDQLLLEKIKTVATQKAVVYLSDKADKTKGAGEIKQLQHDLPYSKIVYIYYDSRNRSMRISGSDQEAVATISTIFKNAGYPIAA